MLRLQKDAEWDKESRVQVYTMDGVQIGVPGVGEGKKRLTFPSHWTVREALACTVWIREATPEELASMPAGWIPTWWREVDQPKALVHANGAIAFPEQCMGCVGNHLTALAQEATVPEMEEKKCIDVDDINTPPTPD